jgi:H+-transporting ATPase
MTVAALLMGLVKLGFTTSVILIGRHVLGLDIATLQTLAFVTLVFGGQAVVYVVRERSWLWSSLPSTWLLLASAVDIGLAATLAGSGVLMKPLPVPGLIAVALATIAFALVLDILKVRLMRRLVRL